MDFAKKLMEKYGWKDGDGLGKNNDGIEKPLKPSLKFDTTGLGADKAAEFNNHWWERVFNEAAKNIDVKDDGKKIVMDVKDKDSVEITTKEFSINKLKKKTGKNAYNNFLNTSTLTNLGNEVENPEKVSIEDIEMPSMKNLTDEELFAACGGRTAHKGARHGLILSGKLSRIEQQEKELLAKLEAPKEENEWTVVASKKKKKPKKDNLMEQEGMEESINKLLFNVDYCNKSKKKKKKQHKIEKDLSSSLDDFQMGKKEIVEEKSNLLKLNKKSKGINKKDKKKKKKHYEDMDQDDDNINTEVYRNVEELKEDAKVQESVINFIINEKHKKSKKKKNKNNDLDNESTEKKKVKNGKVQKMKCEDKKKAKKFKKSLKNILDNIESGMSIACQS